MRLILSKETLGEAANLLSKVINSKCALPILGDIMCEVKDNQLKMTASDSEVTMSTTVNLDTMEGDGRFCISATDLKASLDMLVDQPVTITVDNQFILEHKTGRAYFPMEDANEYPLPMEGNFNMELHLNGGDIRDSLKRSMWAQADDELRAVMCGTCFALKDGYLDIVASNGFSLVKTRISVIDDVKMEDELRVVIPKKVVNILSAVISDESITIRANERMAQIEFGEYGEYTITTRLIEGEYPNYDAVIPQDSTMVAVVPRAFMLNSLRKVIPFSCENCGNRLIRMAFTSNMLNLTAEDYDCAKGANDKFTIDYEAQDITIGASGAILINIMSKMKGQEIEMRMIDPSRAFVFTEHEPDDGAPEVLMLCVPMLIND